MKYTICVTGSSWGGSETSCKSLNRSTAVGIVTVGDCVTHRFTIGVRGGVKTERFPC